MNYLMQDLLKLSLEERLYIISQVLETPETEKEKKLSELIKEKI